MRADNQAVNVVETRLDTAEGDGGGGGDDDVGGGRAHGADARSKCAISSP